MPIDISRVNELINQTLSEITQAEFEARAEQKNILIFLNEDLVLLKRSLAICQLFQNPDQSATLYPKTGLSGDFTNLNGEKAGAELVIRESIENYISTNRGREAFNVSPGINTNVDFLNELNASIIEAIIEAKIPELEVRIVETEKKLNPKQSKKTVLAEANKKQAFARINPIGKPEEKDASGKVTCQANTLKDGRKVCRSVRMEKEMVNDVEKVRLFYSDQNGDETSILVDWVVDCSGQNAETENQLSNFFSQEKNNINGGQPIDIIRRESNILEFNESGNRNEILNGLVLQNLECLFDESTGKTYSKIIAKTKDNKEFIFEIAGMYPDKLEFISPEKSREATRTIQAIERCFQKPDIASIKQFTEGGDKVKFGESSRYQRKPVEFDGMQSKLPVASQLVVDGEEEDIFYVGPTNRFAITDKERKDVPALSDVNANLASMFRYVPAVEEFARKVFAKKLRESKLFALDNERYSSVKDRVRAESERTKGETLEVLDSPDEEKIDQGEITDLDLYKIPLAADPEVLISYYFTDVFNTVRRSIRTEAGIEASQTELSIKFKKFKINENDKKEPVKIMWSINNQPINLNLSPLIKELISKPAFIGALKEVLPGANSEKNFNINLATGRFKML